ncbi:hypothetical protein CK203_114164 [Vitis vinifera]|uniref:Uncharacterized protein n=1 Tax=Vitis vinifera TaxID=29760 RepID=A0A438F8N9_VITVI|nr:hypothetical protein CK203_114164 [Vitis vinifera]
MAPKKTVSSVRVSEASEKAIDKLNAKEFRERFRIPHDVLIDLVNEEAAMPTEKGGKNVILFTKEQFNAGLRFPLPALFKEFLHFSQIPPSLFIPTLSGKQRMISSVCPRTLPSLQMVTELPDSTKGGAKGLVAVRGGWAGLSQHPSRPFSPNYTLKIPGLELRGHLVDWVEKASFACVCKLFEIDPKERAYKTLLSARNLIEVVREPQEYVINILPRKLAKDEIVPGEHYTVKELPLYQEAKEADAERRRKLLEDRDQKKLKALSGRLPDRSGVRTPPQRKFQEKGGSCEEAWEGCEGTHSSQGRPRTHVGVESFGPSLVAAARLANVAEEAASINHPGNLNPDADAAETAPLEEAGAESQSQPSDDPDRLAIVLVKGPPLKKPRLTRDLQSGLFERLQERQQEIEISCASAHDAHPDGGEVEMATETSAAPAIIPAEDASGPMCPDEDMGVRFRDKSYLLLPPEEESADDAAPASPFSYAELEVKLKQITPDWKAIKPSAKMFDMIETLVRGLRSMSQQHDLFTQLLQTADYMRTFSSRRQEIENQLRLRMEEAEAKTEGRLAAALDVQKEELEREFAVEREELAADYQQQVDDTFIFGYRCCMKKNGIKRDTPSIPPGEEKKLHRSPLPDSLSLFAIFLL